MASVEIIPGEMRLWTDRAAAVRQPAGGAIGTALLADLLRDPGSTRVLVLGPHSDDVYLALGDRDVTVLQRSLSDAEEHAIRFAGHRVVTGDLASFGDGQTWDLVVALDGVERVSSNDRPSVTWADRVAHVVALVAPTGRLVLGVDNPTGALALADARPTAERRETGDWEPPASTDASRPRTLADALGAVPGLTGTGYAAAWLGTRPGLLLAPIATRDARIRSAVAAERVDLAVHALLFDPTDLASDRLAQGRFEDAASAWVLGLGRTAPAGLPAAYLRDATGVVLRLSAEDLAGAATAPLVAERAVDLTQAEDLIALRALVAGYLGWLEKTARWSAPDRTTADGDTFVAVLGEIEPPAGPVALGAAWLARRLLAPDVRRIWPPWMGEDALARTLAAMAGIALDPADLADAAAALPAPPVVTEDLRSLRALNAQLREELVSARGEVYAHERLATSRDRQLETRSVRLARAERRADMAGLRAEHAEGALAEFNAGPFRRIARAIRHPRAAARWVKARLRR
jgi:hypothetical protein